MRQGPFLSWTFISVAGRHFLQEDAPDEIGRAIAEWVTELG
jgi:hypothetical protein